MNKLKHIELFESFLETKFELIGDNIDEVLGAVNVLKFHYGKDNLKVEDNSGHESGQKVGVYITFSEDIKLRTSGVNPKSNIVNEINYVLEEEMKKVKLYKVDSI